MFLWSNIPTPIKMASILLLLMITFNLGLHICFDVYRNSITVMMEWNIYTMNSFNFSFPILIDKTSSIFVTVVMIISFSVMMFTVSYMNSDQNLEYFSIMVMLFVMSMTLLVLSPNLITLLLGWDGLGLTSYLLVIYYMNSKSLAAGMLTAMTNRIGDALLILAVSWAMIAGNWNFHFSSFESNILIMMMILLAAMTKSAQMPFSAWLPAAMAAPTPVSALVHSSTLVTAGVYLIIRFYPSLSEFYMTKFLCFYLGAMTCIMASTSATFENDMKKIIALSTLSQLGIMMMALGMEQPNLAFFHLITHALFKALLFICAGSIIHVKSSNQDIRLMGEMISISPLNMTIFNIANLSLCGIPFMAGFYSKDAIVETFFANSNMPIFSSTVLLMSVCMTAAYTTRLSLYTLWTPPKSTTYQNYCSKSTYVAYSMLLIWTITGGLVTNWMIMPMPSQVILPTMMKMYVMMMIVIMVILTMWLFKAKTPKFLTHFFGSMWFLTHISSNPLNKTAMNLSKNFIYNEMTWMEKISGKSSLNLTGYVTKFIISQEKVSLSEMLTTMIMIMVLMFLAFI